MQLRPGDVIVADRYYASTFMIAMLVGLGVDVVIRQHQCRVTDFRRGLRLGTRDHVVNWTRPKRPTWMEKAAFEAIPEQLTLREARAGGWTIVSSLTDACAVSKQELLELYRMRWQVELDLRSIKAVMKMDVLRCKRPDMFARRLACICLPTTWCVR